METGSMGRDDRAVASVDLGRYHRPGLPDVRLLA
jgi:hypothetical protein